MRKTNIIGISVIILALLLLTPMVHALGITPGRTTLNFQAGLEKEVNFKILNNEHKALNLAVYARGALADYIDLPVKEIQFSPEENSKELTYKLKLPDKLEEPGLYGTEIVLREVTIEKEEKEISIGTMQAVISQLHVYVPYPGKYIVITRVDMVEKKADNKMLFFIPLVNFGKEDVESAKAKITIMDLDENIIAEAETDEQPVPAESRAELSSSINSSKLTAGIYKVIVEVTYDGFTTIAENAFYTDDFLLIPLDISVRDFTLGDIAKFNILTENIGNREIEEAYSLILLDSEGRELANIKSTSTDFKAFETKEMLIYWDTKDVKEDEYTGKLVIKYEDRSDENEIKTVVTQNEIKTEIIGITGYAIKEEGLSPGSSSTIMWVIIILVLMNIGWFAFYFLSGKKKSPQKPEKQENLKQPIDNGSENQNIKNKGKEENPQKIIPGKESSPMEGQNEEKNNNPK